MRQSRREFDTLKPNLSQSRITIRHATRRDLEALYPEIDVALSHRLAGLETIETARQAHPDNIWAIDDTRTRQPVGIYAMIMLTAAGAKAVATDSFDPLAPKAAFLAGPDDQLAAIYTWGVYTPGRAKAAIPMIAEKLRAPQYRSLNIYGNGTTEAGRRTMRDLGFEQVSGSGVPHLFVYRRLSQGGAAPSPQETMEHPNA